MLFQVGGEGTRPTFFEMAAAQQLPSSLRAALTYSLGVSAVFLVVLPYLKSKLHGVYNQEREARLRESLWGTEEDQGFDEADFFSGEEPVVSRGGSGSQELSVGVQLATRIKKFIAVCYPWIHASCEGLSFTYQLLYLLDASGFYSLWLQALGIQVCRATVQEMIRWIHLQEFQR